MWHELRAALVVFLTFTVLTGIAYPGAITLLGQAFFSDQASGSVVFRDGRAVGSRLLGQAFSSPGYFWSRPSATAGHPYNGALSGGSNLGPLNPALESAVRDRIVALRAADRGHSRPVPVDLVTASGSGLDPHVSLAAADFQVARVAHARGLTEARVRELVQNVAEGRTFGVFGEPRVNVLELNLALDRMR